MVKRLKFFSFFSLPIEDSSKNILENRTHSKQVAIIIVVVVVAAAAAVVIVILNNTAG